MQGSRNDQRWGSEGEFSDWGGLNEDSTANGLFSNICRSIAAIQKLVPLSHTALPCVKRT